MYDVIVIGAGSGGLTSAIGLKKIGKEVLLIEKDQMGGECTNSGCIPSKALLHRAKSYHHAKQIAGETGQTESYRNNALSYVRDTIKNVLEEETPDVLRAMGVAIEMGEAIFKTKCSLEVNGQEYAYKHAIIATGSSPRLLNIEGLSEEDVLTNQNIFELKEIPSKLLIIGSGPIGMEMGEAFSMLGSNVTIASIDGRFARLEDEMISSIIEEKFNSLGIKIHLNASIQKVEDKTAIFVIKNSDEVLGEEHVVFDKVLIAIGRTPNIPKGLHDAGIKSDTACIKVDNQYRTSNKHVYALGDVTQRLKFTHTADDTARQVVTRIATKKIFRVSKRKAVPKVTYTLPEIAQVGLSYTEALQKYDERELMRIEVSYLENDRAKTDEKTDGLMIVTVRRVLGTVLGANIIGENAGDLISIFGIAIDRKISMWRLRSVIYPYPTYSLLVKKAGDHFFGRQVADLKKDLMYCLMSALPKIVALLFWGTLIFFYHHYKIENALSYRDMMVVLFQFFTETAWGPIAYMAVYAIRPLIFFPATLLTALSGALFGFWWGILFTILGENTSANLAYWIGRFFGNGLKLEDSIIGNWVHKLRNEPFGSVLFMRLFYVPFDLTNYGSGILKVPWVSYFFATLIGIMPGLTVFVALGAGINDITNFELTFDAFNIKFILLSAIIFSFSILGAKLLKRWHPTKEV